MHGDRQRLKGQGFEDTAVAVAVPAGEAAAKTALLIAGMHRSGTSALARTLSLLGCDLPETLMKPNPNNPRGFWESRAIMKFNDEILKSAGSWWDDWEPINPGWLSSPVAEGFKAQAQEVLAAEFGPSRLFVLKDPRICRLMPFWLDALEAFGARPLVVCPIRNPLEVAASLETRNGFDPAYGQLLWLRHVLDAEAASRGMRRAFLRYEDLLDDWQAATGRLAAELDLAWPRQATATDLEIEAFLATDLRHHARKDASVVNNPRLAGWIRTSFAILRRWAQGDIREDDAAELDRVRAALDAAAPAFARLLLVGREAARRAAANEAKAADLGEKLTAEEARTGALSQALEAREEELSRAAARLAAEEARAGVCRFAPHNMLPHRTPSDAFSI